MSAGSVYYHSLWPRLICQVYIAQIFYSYSTGVETWITSDGRVYLVHLRPEDGYEGVAHTDTVGSVSDREDQVRLSTHVLCLAYSW